MKRLLLVALAVGMVAPAVAAPAACKGTIYLTFDTGSQSQAELIAETLKRHSIKATFFLANEKTVRGDYSLDPSWSAYWKARVAEGHAIGSHTFDHDVLVKDVGDGFKVKPGFGASAGKLRTLTPAQYCEEIKRVDQRFVELTGKHLDPIWRAPAGRTSPGTLAAAKACGYAHVGWAPANLEPLISGLEQKGFCFATLREHPGYKTSLTSHH